MQLLLPEALTPYLVPLCSGKQRQPASPVFIVCQLALLVYPVTGLRCLLDVALAGDSLTERLST